MRPFAEFLGGLRNVPQDVDRLTVGVWDAWRLSLPPLSNGYYKYNGVAGLVAAASGSAGAVREAMGRRFAWTRVSEEASGPKEFRQIRTAARRTFRSALLRIRENTEYLADWRDGAVEAGGTRWLLGEALDVLAPHRGRPRLR